MKALMRLGVLTLLLAGLCFADEFGSAQDAKKAKTVTAPLTAESLSLPLVPPEILPKVNLTAQQKPTADKLISEFATKNKELVAKVPASAIPATPAKGKGKSVALPQELMAVFLLRAEYEKKFEELLTDAQSKVYNDLLAKRAEALMTKTK